ncbi:thioredoxin domain-containing protein 9 homolog isoform X2 [Camellia sinensis]|uniref:Thioredoxin domain-containing protein n=1 Tax=Camellia sinensis var. sinensis TaxID=542762 RepID=A0A4V3WK95_CAMSN|nr:thioredoxin domain-containing protein 9 homolog isoform X2 [Camellia sinensis]THG00027.1 hypothetical protein TEA_017564 [Camellia sinensis var. sinensis]
MDNSKVQEIIEKQVLTVAKAVEEKIDDEIHTLDRLDLDDINVLRECCHQQIKKMKEKQSRWIALSHGENSEIPAEKDIFSVVMDKHLSILSKQHIETRFVKIHAEKSPFLAEKLKIVVPPTLALIKSAKVDDYVGLAKAQVIFYEGESSLNPSKSSAKSRSVRQSSNSHSLNSDS